jgi:hypothetical protein
MFISLAAWIRIICHLGVAHVVTSYSTFRETQYLRAWWYIILIASITVLPWWGAVTQLVMGEPWGNNPASDEFMIIFLVIFGVFFPLFLFYIHLVVEVSDAVYIRFRPFMIRPRIIRAQDIVTHRAEEYDPLGEYGGWGIKGFSSNRAYNVSGRKGVRIVLKDGRMVMIGSQRAEELSTAISHLVRTAPRT